MAGAGSIKRKEYHYLEERGIGRMEGEVRRERFIDPSMPHATSERLSVQTADVRIVLICAVDVVT